MRIIREEVKVKGEAAPRVVELKFTRHGPVFYEDTAHHRAYVAKSVNQEPGTAPFKGSLKLAQATSCEDFFDRAMFWKVPTHNLICGDTAGNIALQVSGLTPDRDGWTGRLPVPGTGKYEWKGFRSDLPREYNPERGFIATANDNSHPPGYKGRPVLYRTSVGVEVSRIARIRQMLGTGAEVLRRRPRAHAARRLLAARRARPAAVPGLEEQGPRCRARARHGGRLGQGAVEGHDAWSHLRPLDRHRSGARRSRRERPPGPSGRRWSRRDSGRRSTA